MGRKLPRKFYLREDTVSVARDLLGKLIVVPDEKGRRVSGMIVETEAYLGTIDRAAHSYRGRRTPRNEVTYGRGGHVYVFFIYGMYYQLNIVCGVVASPHVVLIRAVEPVEGVEIMRDRRNRKKSGARTSMSIPIADKNLTSGPGKLCIAFAIERGLNGEDLLGDKIWLEEYRSLRSDEVAVGKRIGIDYAGEDAHQPWRFWVDGNGYVSRFR